MCYCGVYPLAVMLACLLMVAVHGQACQCVQEGTGCSAPSKRCHRFMPMAETTPATCGVFQCIVLFQSSMIRQCAAVQSPCCQVSFAHHKYRIMLHHQALFLLKNAPGPLLAFASGHRAIGSAGACRFLELCMLFLVLCLCMQQQLCSLTDVDAAAC